MPTLKPRATFTLEPRTMQLLERLSAAQGVTKSDLVQDLIETARGPLERLVVMTETARSQKSKSMAEFGAGLHAAERALLRPLEHTLDQRDWLLSAVAEMGEPATVFVGRLGEKVKPSRAKKQTRPPPSNRGVTPPGVVPTTGTQKPTSRPKIERLEDARTRRGSKP